MNKVRMILAMTLILSLLLSVASYAETPATASDLLSLGIEAFEEENYNEVVKQCDAALALDPKLNDAYLWKADALFQLEMNDEGLKCIEQAIAQNPDISLNYYYKGFFLFNLSKYADAVAAFKVFIDDDYYDIEEVSTDAYYKMAQAYLLLNDTENCLLTLRHGVFLFPKLKEHIEENGDFESLAANKSYVEFMNDEREAILDEFLLAFFVYEDFFEDLAFLDASKHMSESEKQEIKLFNTRFNTNMTAGNIYNASTAKSYGLSDLCPLKETIIAMGRLVKKMSLLGIKGTYTLKEFNVLYVGKLNGQLKAAIVSEKGTLSFAGLSTTESQDYHVYIKNNGVWELYTNLYDFSQLDKLIDLFN